MAPSFAAQLLPAGTPIMAPTTKPGPKAVQYSELDRLTAHTKPVGDPLSPAALGKLRVETLKELASCPENDSAAAGTHVESILTLAILTLQTVNSLTEKPNDRTFLWNDELEADVFLARTLLLADHVFVPDLLLNAASREPTNRSLREVAQALLKHKNLLTAGVVIPIPDGVTRAVQGRSVQERTAQDLSQKEVVDFIRSQLILEGPTAREVLFATVKDDLEVTPRIWFHARIDPDSLDEAGKFLASTLHSYDPDYDYGPWVSKVENDAISYYAQRTNERLVSADIFGAQYVSASTPGPSRDLGRYPCPG